MVSLSITQVQGDDYNLVVVMKNENGEPIDITGYTFYLTGKQYITDEEPAFEETYTYLPCANYGVAILLLPRSKTILLEGKYVIDVKYKGTTDKVTTLGRGEVIFERSVKEVIA